jgi:RNA polymerase sigma-70 factor (ECF subfamily)
MSQELPEQAEIVEQLRSDREEALAELYLLVRERLRRVIDFRLDYRLGGRVSHSDVLQETYVRAAQRIDSYLQKPDMPFFVWLRLEANQRLQEIHRFHFGAEKRDIRREVKLKSNKESGNTSVQLAAHIVGQMTSPSGVFHKAQQVEALEKTLSEMNDTDREVIALRHFEELSNIEAAKVLGIAPEAASKRYIRALKRLKEIMQQHAAF